VAAACGGDPVDLTGVYRVDRAVGSAPCGADMPITYSPYLVFERHELAGQPVYTYAGCADEAMSGCIPMGGLFEGFAEPIDDGWRGVITFASGGAMTDCRLGYVLQTAILVDRALAVEVTSHGDRAPELSGAACSPAEADRRGAAMACLEHTLVEATKL
jgi:hypothetical protein